ncbi:hypothetical protein [Dorea sp. D27]|uniref:hypothetical protein n=1 Tax=Dorea sp. D27 TaxID=658665 RepID=UPI0006739147|nr:hypothetical protein [Dorea sp. D27]KMZ53353.1 hypothetical protein HMPREF0980_02596 [Dorea sp. D27]
MRNHYIRLCVAGLLTLSVLAGCAKGQEDKKGQSGPAYCTDKEILSMLKNDGTPEFVLDGVYYELPASVGDFTGQGWDMSLERYEGGEVMLQPGESIDVTFSKEERKMNAVVVNQTVDLLEAGDECQVIQVEAYASSDTSSSDFFVTEQGICLNTPEKDAEKLLSKKDGYEHENGSDTYILTMEEQDRPVDYLTFSNSQGFARIKIASADRFTYTSYIPTEEKKQEAAAKITEVKENAEESMKPYAKDYDKLVKDLESTTAGFHSKGAVQGKASGIRENMINIQMESEASFYMAEDESGQIYYIYEGYTDTKDAAIKLPQMQAGEKIELWGSATNIMELEDGSRFPVIMPKIIEKDGQQIYLSEELQLK